MNGTIARWLSYAAIALQLLWLASLIWLVAFGTGCEVKAGTECDLESLPYVFWAGIEVLILPPFIAGFLFLVRASGHVSSSRSDR